MAFFYQRDGDAFVPSALARSPWEKGKQNGVGLGGLLAHLIDGIPAPAPMVTARLVIDILSAAPFEPLTGHCDIVREGRRMQHVQAELLAGGRAVARATALRVRDAVTPIVSTPTTYPEPETVTPAPFFLEKRAFGGTLETRPVHGGLREPGPGTLWVRFGHEHVEDVPLTPLVRTAMLGDFGSGLSRMLPLEAWTFANLDISIHMLRPPEGEFLLIDAKTASAGNGQALVSAVMADRSGVFAHAYQTLFVAAR